MPDIPLVGDPVSGLLLNATANLIEELYNPDKLKRVEAAVANGVAKGQTIASGAAHQAQQAFGWKTAEDTLEFLTKFIIKLTDIGAGALDPIAKGTIDSLLSDETSGRSVGQNAGARLISKVAGNAQSIEPGIEGAARYATLMLHEQVEAFLRQLLIEVVTEFMPRLSPWGGGIENAQRLQEIVESALGGARMMRRILQPFVQATAITPAQWHVNKTYRPELLSPASVMRQFARGNWDWPDVVEELARQGYSDARIAAFVNEQRKFLSPAEVNLMLRHNVWSQDQARDYMRAAGFYAEDARDALRVEGERRFEQQDNALTNVLIAAFERRDIEKRDLVETLQAKHVSDSEIALAVELADVRRAVNIKFLTSGDVAQMIEAGILAYVDYREALQREGYLEDAIIAKELLLRFKLEQQKSIETHRTELAAERAAEKAQRDADRAAKRAQVEAARAEARRGDEADLEAAAIRGLIPFARVEDVYRQHYDEDTVGILVDLLEARRQDYLAEQQRRKDAEQRATARGLSVADLAAGVLAHVLDLGRYREALALRGVPAGDVDILARTLEVRLKEQDAAEEAREDARQAAARRAIDLGRYERLVRLGRRTLAQYAALVASLGFNDAAVADMVELLQAEIAQDAKARAERQTAGGELARRGLSLEEFRRAAILGQKTLADFAAFMRDQKFTADRQALLYAELEAAVADADAARTRRSQTDARPEARALPLSTIARAARLGVLTPAQYQARLVAFGYGDEDVALELELLATEAAEKAPDSADEAAALAAALRDELEG